MVETTPFRRPINWSQLRPDDAERIIRERASTTSNVIIGIHAFDRIEERTIIQSEVFRILRTGFVEGEPVKNDQGDWEVIVSKRMAGGRAAGAVTVIVRQADTLFVKTVMWMDLDR